MKRLIPLMLVFFAILSNTSYSGADEIDQMTAAAIARGTFLENCGYSEKDAAEIVFTDPRALDLSGKAIGKGSGMCWVVNIDYPVQYEMKGAMPCVVFSASYTVIMSAEDGEVIEKGDGSEFVNLIEAGKRLKTALTALEERQRAKGDFQEWSEEDRQAFLNEFGDYYAIPNCSLPGPEGVQVWEAFGIAREAIGEKYGASHEKLANMKPEISYTMLGGDSLVCNVILINDAHSELYDVNINAKTGEVTNII